MGATVESLVAVAHLAALLALAAAAYSHLRVLRRLCQQVGAQVEATGRAIEATQAQRRDAVRPVLVLALRALEPDAGPTTARFRLAVTNAGAGPAFDVLVTPVGMPSLTEGPDPASDGASPDLVAAGQTLALDFAAPTGARRGARTAELGEGQPAGELVVAFRDSFNVERTTRARLATTRRIEGGGAYGLRIASQVFGE